MDFTISRHAEEQMLIRDIPRTLLDTVLREPEQRIVSNERWVYQSRVTIGGRPFLLRAVVDENGSPFLVVTVYRTTKIAQYWKSE